MALLNVLLPILLVVFSFGELLRFRIFQSVSIGPLDLVIFLVFVIWFFRYREGKYKLLKPIVIFSGLALLSLIINVTNYTQNQLLISSLYLLRWILYSSVYFVFRDIGKAKSKKIQNLITLSGIVVLIVGFVQYFFYPSLRGLYYLGWDEHLSRLFSSFLDPNFAGIILVLFFVFVFAFKDVLFKKKKNVSLVVLGIIFIAIILTYSRGAILMFIACVLFYSVVKKEWKTIVGAIAVLVLVFLILSPGFYLENTNLLRSVSTKERVGTAIKAIQIFEKNPFGVGFDTYRYAREKYGEKDVSIAGPSHSGAGVDNSLIFVLVTTGIFGFISYCYLLYKMFKLGFSKLNNRYGLILVISWFGLIINSLTINSLFYSFVMVWIWMLAGLTESN